MFVIPISTSGMEWSVSKQEILHVDMHQISQMVKLKSLTNKHVVIVKKITSGIYGIVERNIFATIKQENILWNILLQMKNF